jgi:exonuclease III
MADSATTIAKERRALMNLMGEGPFKVPNRRVDENLLIATWNIQHFSNRHTNRAIQYIADICERFDIVALQEVKTDLRGLSRLQKKLPGNYKILVTDPTGNNERFAFLYDKRTVIPTGLVCEIGFNVSGEAHEGFQLHRMPYCASFRAGRFDFVIASAHIFFGKGSKGKDMRQKEIEHLAKFIQKRAETESAKVFDRDFFVVGDFNIEREGGRFFKALEAQNFFMPPGRRTNFGRTKTFDRIVWVKRESFEFTEKINVVPFGEVLFQDKAPKGGRKEISDHLPLWAEFEIKKLTQELDQILNPGG